MAYYCLLQLHITPRQYYEMDDYEKAFIIASLRKKGEDDKQRQKEMERKAKRHR